MSDSDDLTENNVFPNENTFLRGQGPFMNNKFKRIASSTYSNPIPSQNFMNQSSIYHGIHRRETSPMSMQSIPDFSQYNFDGSYYGRGISCQRSIINRRSQSPASVASMDSTTGAAYVVQLFKDIKFNKYDLKTINEAYDKYIRNRERRRIRKRQKLKTYFERNRRKSGDDSGDDGSNSSISNDDNRSVRSTIPRESILKTSNRSNRTNILHLRATMKKSDMYKDCTENLKHSMLKNMFNGHNTVMHTIPKKADIEIQREKDCNPINNILQEKVTNGLVGMQKERFTKGFVLPSQRFNKSIVKSIANMPLNVCLSPDRNNANNTDSENEEIFSNRTIRENTGYRKRTLENNDIICPDEKRNKLSPNTSNILRDDITFKKPQIPLRRQIKAKPNFLSKPINSNLSQPIATSIGQASYLSQSLNQDKSLSQPYRKLNGFLNIRNTVHAKADNSKQVNTDIDNDEIFAINTTDNLKSNLTQQKVIGLNRIDHRNDNNNIIASPAKTKTNKGSKIKKNNTQKNCQQLKNQMQYKDKLTEEANAEILISKSLQPLVANVENITTIPSNKSQTRQVNTEDGNNVNTSEKPLSVSEVSMKPSFIKRKLFTQKLDIAEEKNMSNDNSINSPQTRNYKSREKNKVRKFATSQSCLSRDVIGEEDILDLIHKIVPADQINMTAASNQRTRKSNPDNEDKWDVASVISMCNNSNESDTYTDEEIFHVNKANNKNKNQDNIKTTKATELQNLKVVLEKIPDIDCKKMESIADVKNTNCATKRTVASRVRSFWDTDFESDVEDNIQTPLKPPANRLGQIGPLIGQIKKTDNVTHQENIPQPKNRRVNRNIQDENERKYKNETKTQRKQTQKVKVVKSILNDTLNSSMGEHSILLRRSPRLKSKQQLLLNGINSTDNDSKPTPKPISKAKTKNTPKRNTPKGSLGSNKKKITISAANKSTPLRRAKEKKIELTKLNESCISTRNRSLNTSLRLKQQRNLKQTK